MHFTALIMLLSLVGLIALGVILIFIGFGRGRTNTCPKSDCQHRNPPAARYCAHCGTELRTE